MLKRLLISLVFFTNSIFAGDAGFYNGVCIANGAQFAGQLSVTGSTDVTQLQVRANATQTQNLLAIQNFNGSTTYFSIDGVGASIFTGNVQAAGFVGPLTGNATTATRLQTARTINGVSFDGTADIIISAATINPLTISTGLQLNSGSTFDGSAAKTLSIDSTVATLTGSQILTNKTISGTTNTLSNIGNSSLTNSSLTVNGTAISLGASGTVTAAASTLTGSTLASGVTASSLTSVGTLTGLTVSSAGAVTPPTATTQLNVSSSTANSARMVFSGNAFNTGNSSEGLAFLLGRNDTTERTLWLADSSLLASNSTNPIFRIGLATIANGGPYIDAISTNGAAMALKIQPSGGALTIGGSTLVPSLIASPGGAVSAPAIATSVNAVTNSTYKANLVISGTSFQNNTSTDGIALGLNYNQTGNRQLSITDSAFLASGSSSTNSQLRIAPAASSGGVNIESLGLDGATGLPLNLNTSNNGLITVGNGGIKYNNTTGAYTGAVLNYYEEYSGSAASSTTLTTNPGNIVFKIVRVGKSVVLTVNDWGNFRPTSTSAITFASGTIPSRFAPTSNNIYWQPLYNNGSAIVSGLVKVGTDGSITLYSSANIGTFSNATTYYQYAFAMPWSV